MQRSEIAARSFSPAGSINPIVARSLRSRLQEAQAALAGQVAAGLAQDWADYKYRVGRIAGIQEAIDLCSEVEHDLRGQ